MPPVLRLAALVLLALGSPAASGAQDEDGQSEVLVLYAVRRDAQIAVVGDRDLPRLLQEGTPAGVDYYSEFMDVARLAQSDYELGFRRFLELKYAEHRFDLI